MTLDAGGTNFRFSAIRAGQPVTKAVTLPSDGDNLSRCLANLVEGFTAVKAQCPAPPAAISFAFPGPADYPAGIIGDLGNLPGFRGGVALGPMLREKFGIPVFINNDGDLFVYGEALAGLLPRVNGLLAKAGSPKRYKNLFGVVLGTGFGGGSWAPPGEVTTALSRNDVRPSLTVTFTRRQRACVPSRDDAACPTSPATSCAFWK